MKNYLSQINLYEGDTNYTGFGPLGLEGDTPYDLTFQSFISTSIGLISIIALIWFVFIITTSGIAHMNAGADQKATEAARKRITNGLVGLLITIFGIFLLRLVGQIFNIANILDIPNLLRNITGRTNFN